MDKLTGKSISEEICIGRLLFYGGQEPKVFPRPIGDVEEELARFAWARGKAAEQLHALYGKAEGTVGPESAAIFQAHEMLLEDVEYVDAVAAMVRGQRVNLEYAIRTVGENMAQALCSLEDGCLRERAQDIRDVSRRLVRVLLGAAEGGGPQEPCIIAADDLLPSETVQLPRDKVLGFAMRGGSSRSHTAILAGSMGVPALLGVGAGLKEEYDGMPAAIDGGEGVLYINPDEETLTGLRRKIRQQERRREALDALKGKENITRDGRSVQVFANVGSLEEARRACGNDAGGIGLLRSEILYLERDSEPDEEYQFRFYKAVLETMGGKEVVVRTMDIGADKQVSYLGLAREENPAMGLRAIRLCLARPELLTTQLRALYRAGLYGPLRIMYPMITSVAELKSLRELEGRAKAELEREGVPFRDRVPTGIMIETPAAALVSDELAPEVDFFSVGTNDLIQYTYACDRQQGGMEEFVDPRLKAVLKLIRMAVESAHRAGIRIGICGELAAQESMTEELLRMGIDELSVPPGMVLPLRGHIRGLDVGRRPPLSDPVKETP